MSPFAGAGVAAPAMRSNGDKASVRGSLSSAAGASAGAGAGGTAPEPTLHDHLAVVARRKWSLLLVVVLALVIATTASMAQTTLYRAEAELLLRPTASEQLLSDERGQVRSATDAQRALNNELRLVDSSPVREAVANAYDGPLDIRDDVRIFAPSADATDVIEIAVTAHDPAAATELANRYADTFIEVRRQQHVDDLLATGDEIETKLGQLRSEIAMVSTPLTQLDARAASATTPAAKAAVEAQRATVADRLAPRLESLQRRESFYAAQLDQVQVSVELSRSGGVQLLSSAELPDTPVSPNVARNVVVGGLIGLLAGLGLVFARDRLDDSVASKEECERVTGLPILGLIPKARPGGAKDGDDLITLSAPLSAAAEAYRSLRTSVRFLGVDQPVRTILVTSPSASEGKTTLAVNLGVVLAQAGERVLLVSADLRRPRLHDVFGIHPQPGLTTVLVGETSRHAAVCLIDEVPGLEVMPPGASPPNPSELLDGDRAHELLAELAAGYDAVIIDSPPLLPVTDAQVLASRADVTLLVVAHGETSRRGLVRSLELLHQVGASVAGTVLNLVTTTRGYGTYTYDQTYGERSGSRRLGLGRRKTRARKKPTATRRAPAIHPIRRHAGDHLHSTATPETSGVAPKQTPAAGPAAPSSGQATLPDRSRRNDLRHPHQL